MRSLLSVTLSALILLASALPAAAMGVEEAYAAIPHRRTVFDVVDARMRPEEKEYLSVLFPLLEEAIVARVATTRWFTTGGKSGVPYETYNSNAEALVDKLKGLDAPPRLKNLRKELLEALKDQDAYFRDWIRINARRTAESKKLLRNIDSENPYVQKSHRSLLAAYMMLSNLYPHESQHNQQSFYDTLCALDFI